MPTGSKLVAALCLGLLAIVVAEMVKAEMPTGTIFGFFTPVSGLLGLLVGWRQLGPRAGAGAAGAINDAITATTMLVFLALFVFATYSMVEQAMLHRYSGVTQALRGILEIGMSYGIYLLNIRVIATLIGGAALAGLATEYADRHWR